LEQQILAELQKLNRRMDTLNPALSGANVTRLFGPRSLGRVPPWRGSD
jgi:hypothetical protein